MSAVIWMLLGAIFTGIAFAHPIGPALMLGAVTPFDAIPYALFGVAGNAITFIPILILLAKVNPGLWGSIFLGTRVQQFGALWIFLLLVSHAMVLAEQQSFLLVWEWLRKLTLFMLMSLFGVLLIEARYTILLVRFMVISMVIFSIMSMFDYYLGIQLLPIPVGIVVDILDTERESWDMWRFTGAGYPVNRYANYLIMLIFLSIGWIMQARGVFDRTLASGCAAMLILCELLTVSRSAMVGIAIGAVILLPLAFRFNFAQVIGIAIIGGVFGTLVWYGATFSAASEIIANRFTAESLAKGTGGRIERIIAAFAIWSEHPFIGVGWKQFPAYSWRWVHGGGLGAHNSYLAVMAETGILGLIPMAAFLITVLRRMLKSVGQLAPEIEFWRPYFLAALVAQLSMCLLNDYMWERYLWLTFGYAVVLERVTVTARMQAARERLEAVQNFGARSRGPLPAAGAAR